MTFEHGDETPQTLTGHAVFDNECRRVGVITDVLYDEFEQHDGAKAIPNVNQTANLVYQRLRAKNISASKRLIIDVAKDPSVATRRRLVGPTIANDRRSKEI